MPVTNSSQKRSNLATSPTGKKEEEKSAECEGDPTRQNIH